MLSKDLELLTAYGSYELDCLRKEKGEPCIKERLHQTKGRMLCIEKVTLQAKPRLVKLCYLLLRWLVYRRPQWPWALSSSEEEWGESVSGLNDVSGSVSCVSNLSLSATKFILDFFLYAGIQSSVASLQWSILQILWFFVFWEELKGLVGEHWGSPKNLIIISSRIRRQITSSWAGWKLCSQAST